MPTKSFFIFDREGAGHAWEQPLRELSAASDERRRAVAENWGMDHRVSCEREAGDLLLCDHLKKAGDGTDWLASLFRYHVEHICQPSDSASNPRSAYLGSWNDSNCIRDVAPKDRLCHVGSLRAIVRRALNGASAVDAAMAFTDQVGVPLPEKSQQGKDPLWLYQEVDRFAKDLNKAGEEKVRTAARILLEALGPKEPPWWACFAEEILDYIEAGSTTDICKALGLGHFESPDWLIVWNYSVNDAWPLYRPTVAEATDNPFHYPSPPSVEFGITMLLDQDVPPLRRRTYRELLHRPLRGLTAETSCTGKLLSLEDFPQMGDNVLRQLRRLHRGALQLEFQSEMQRTWLDRHTDL